MPTTCHCAVAQSVERPSLMGVQIMPRRKVVGKNHRKEILAAPSVAKIAEISLKVAASCSRP